MQHFQTRYGQPIVLILNAYPPGSPGLTTGLEALCRTAEQNGRKQAKTELAQAVCEQLHTGAPTGIKCLDCHYAETQYGAIAEVEAEMEMVRQAKAAGDAAPPPEKTVPEIDDGLSDDELKKVLEGISD